MHDITAFTDCSIKTVVLRIPYEIACEMAVAYPNEELRDKLIRASNRSTLFKQMLRESGLI